MDNNKQDAIVKKESFSIIKSPEPARILVEPLADLFETADEFILKLDIPGVFKDSIGLRIESSRLTINAMAKDNIGSDTKLLYSEIGLKNYCREFRLGNGIDLDNISARFENGVLTIALPKTEAVKAREIKIN